MVGSETVLPHLVASRVPAAARRSFLTSHCPYALFLKRQPFQQRDIFSVYCYRLPVIVQAAVVVQQGDPGEMAHVFKGVSFLDPEALLDILNGIPKSCSSVMVSSYNASQTGKAAAKKSG